MRPPAALLSEIARDLGPVTPQAPPARFALYLAPLAALAAVLSFLVLTIAGLRGNLAAYGPLLAWGASGAQLTLGVLLIWMAARESTPGRRLPGNVVRLAAFGAVLLIVAFALWTFAVHPSHAPAGHSSLFFGLFCGVAGTAVGLLAVALFAWSFRHSLAGRPAFAGALYGAGAGIAVNAGWRLACPISTPWHSLFAHGSAIVATTLLGSWVAYLVRKRSTSPLNR
jgi:hypothetical protein